MHRTLHSQATLENMKREARELFHALRRGDVRALRQSESLDPQAGTLDPRLADAQYLIAREYGFNSWQKLKASLDRPKCKGES